MPESLTNPEPVVYQLRVVLRGVSPLIWRRLLVRSDSTIADLHTTLQRALGWSDEHLNRFVIHGREYGVWHDGGIGFRDNPRHVRLANLGLRVRERFLYEYDFTDGWQTRRAPRAGPATGARAALPGLYRRPTRGATRRLRRTLGVPGTAPALFGVPYRSTAAGAAQAHHRRRRSPR